MLGTALLIVAINWGHGGMEGDGEAVGIALFVNLVIFGPISGGHFNPAVTLGVLVSNSSMDILKENSLFSLMIMAS